MNKSPLSVLVPGNKENVVRRREPRRMLCACCACQEYPMLMVPYTYTCACVSGKIPRVQEAKFIVVLHYEQNIDHPEQRVSGLYMLH